MISVIRVAIQQAQVYCYQDVTVTATLSLGLYSALHAARAK